MDLKLNKKVNQMSKLVIVESPAKAKTIKKYLGKGYEVVASMGHVRDLPKTKMGVDIENDFEPKYINIKGKGPLIKDLKKSAKGKTQVFLATDPDREGEAISWHLAHILNLSLDDSNRVTFNEITKNGIKSGMASPRKLDMSLIDAQQARRILDRIVGYKLSPFLWKKIRGGLSAGRVQSVAVKIIVNREREIRNFVSKEYWTIQALLLSKSASKPFIANYYGVNGKKEEIENQQRADTIITDIGNNLFIIEKIKNGVRKRSPAPPFITSTLQQEASRKLNFQARQTMRAAQELYEGVDVKSMGAIGLITYMRTDSLRISDEAKTSAAEFINNKYGSNYLPEKPRFYKSKNNSQDGHEAIRPTMPDLYPEDIKASLTADQYKIYKLIWNRFIASQMADCLMDTVSVKIKAGKYEFRASGNTVRFDGFTVLYEEGQDEESEKHQKLPVMSEQEDLKREKITPIQHFTQPPPRFTEASLIKVLENNGIGRPSTYAPTITTIINRTYIQRSGKQLCPTQLGEITTDLMQEHFNSIVDTEFTANMEDNLDLIEVGDKNWKLILKEFYDGFSEALEKAEKNLEGSKVDLPVEETDEVCDNCGKNMIVKMGRFGKFLACPGYPDCKFTKRILNIANGRCPMCESKIVEKKSKGGKKYFGCEKNPNCNFMVWDQPLADECPKCSKSLFKKSGKNGKVFCLNQDCKYERG